MAVIGAVAGSMPPRRSTWVGEGGAVNAFAWKAAGVAALMLALSGCTGASASGAYVSDGAKQAGGAKRVGPIRIAGVRNSVGGSTAQVTRTPGYALSNADPKVDEAAGKCLPGEHVVKILHGKFAPVAGLQRVVATRAADASRGTCVYSIGWQFYSPAAHTCLSRGPVQSVEGPGLIFSNGVWHPQDFETQLHIQSVALIGDRMQLMIYHEEDWMDGSSLSDLGVDAMADGLGTPRTLLQTHGMTPLSYSLGGFLDPQSVLDNPFHKKGSTIGRQPGTFMHVHPGLLKGWWVRTSSLSGSPRMNNLLRDHT